MQFGLIVIGSEIMTGKRRDGHLEFTIDALSSRGLDLSWCHYLGDQPDRLTEFLRGLRWQCSPGVEPDLAIHSSTCA